METFLIIWFAGAMLNSIIFVPAIHDQGVVTLGDIFMGLVISALSWGIWLILAILTIFYYLDKVVIWREED